MDAAKLNEALKPFADLMDAAAQRQESSERRWRDASEQVELLRVRYAKAEEDRGWAETYATLYRLWSLAATLAFVAMAAYHFAAK